MPLCRSQRTSTYCLRGLCSAFQVATIPAALARSQSLGYRNPAESIGKPPRYASICETRERKDKYGTYKDIPFLGNKVQDVTETMMRARRLR